MVWSKPSPPLSFKLNHWKGLKIFILFRNLQEGSLGGGLDGLVETFTPPLFQVESLERGGLEGFILGSYCQGIYIGLLFKPDGGPSGRGLGFQVFNVKPSPFDFGS